MNKWVYILVSICIWSCSSDGAWDCVQTAGTTVTQSYSVNTFARILVNRDVTLVVRQGATYEVVVETGENLLNDIEVVVQGDQLQLSDNNSCNFVRDYGTTTVYVTTPFLSEIRNSSQFEVQNEGVLNFPQLRLLSEDFNEPGRFTVGDFRLMVNNERVEAVANNISSFYISGATTNLRIGFFAGNGRFEGEDLIAQNVSIFHRGSNDMIVNPQQSIEGEILGPGDVISVNTPPVVDVVETYTGRLIFID